MKYTSIVLHGRKLLVPSMFFLMSAPLAFSQVFSDTTHREDLQISFHAAVQ